jgi:hypothetical protein
MTLGIFVTTRYHFLILGGLLVTLATGYGYANPLTINTDPCTNSASLRTTEVAMDVDAASSTMPLAPTTPNQTEERDRDSSKRIKSIPNKNIPISDYPLYDGTNSTALGFMERVFTMTNVS